MTLRVVIVGPGAVGSFLGGTLARAGHDVTLVGREVPATGSGELRLVETDGETLVPVTRSTIDDVAAEAPDLVLLAVKLFDLAAALATVERWPDAPVLTVQNGIGAEQMAVALRRSPVVAASLTTAVEPVTGGVRRLRRGGIGVADARGADAAFLATLAAAFEAGGLAAKVYPDAVAMKWSKVVANLVGNASGAILDMDPQGDLPRPGRVRRRAPPAPRSARGHAASRREARRPAGRARPAAPVRDAAAGNAGAAGVGAGDRRGAGRQVAVAAAPRPWRRRVPAPARRPRRCGGSTARSPARRPPSALEGPS